MAKNTDTDILLSLREAAMKIERIETITSGHITVHRHAVRFTLFRQLDEHMMHVEYEQTWAGLEDFSAGAAKLCDTIINALLEKLDGASCPG